MEWISNRELALIVWFFVVVLISLSRTNTREPAKNCFLGIITPPIGPLIIGLAASAYFWFGIIEPEAEWTNRQNWIAVLWFFTVGIGLLFVVIRDSAEAKWKVFWTLTCSGFTLIAVFEFFVHYGSLSILAELILLPVIFLLTFATQTQISKTLPSNVITLFNWILALIGIVVLLTSAMTIFRAYDNLLTANTIRLFYIPFALSALSTPYLAIVYIIVNYQNALTRVQFFIDDPMLQKYAKINSALSFGLDLSKLKHWMNVIAITRPTSKIEIQQSLRHGYLKTPIKELEW